MKPFLVIYHGMGEIPNKGQVFALDHFQLKILDTSASRILHLKLVDLRVE